MELPSYIYVLAVSFLVSLSVFYKPKATETYLKLFPPFLFATLLVEYLASWLRSIDRNNLAVYNFFTAFEFCFYLLVISIVIQDHRAKRLTRLTIGIYGAIAVINILFIQKIKVFHTVTYALGCLIIVAFCIYYFFELFRRPKYIKLVNNPAFWICSGLLFYYCSSFPLYALINYWIDISRLILKNFTHIIAILNVFLYSLFTIAFLCIRTRKYTLSPS